MSKHDKIRRAFCGVSVLFLLSYWSCVLTETLPHWQLRFPAVELIVGCSYLISLAAVLPIPKLLRPPTTSANKAGIWYVILMLSVSVWWVVSTIDSDTGDLTEGLLGAQLFLTVSSISVILTQDQWPADLREFPLRYGVGYLLFCLALLLMWADSTFWIRQGLGAETWPAQNAILISGWCIGGGLAFWKPQYLKTISIVGLVLLFIAAVVFLAT